MTHPIRALGPTTPSSKAPLAGAWNPHDLGGPFRVGRNRVLHAPDDPPGDGAAGDKGKDGGGDGDKGKEKAGGSDDEEKGKEADGDDKAPKLTKAQQAYVDKQVAEAAAEAARKAKETAAAEFKTEAERKEAEKAGKFEELYNAAKPKVELADRLTTEVNEILDAEIKAWPSELKEADPGKDKVEERAAWVKKNRKLAARLAETPEAPDTEAGKGANKSGTGKNTTERIVKEGEPLTRATHGFQRPGDIGW